LLEDDGVARSMSEILIRPAEADDLAAISRIYADAVRHGTASFEIDPPDQDEMTQRFASLRGGGFPYLVAQVDGAVVGYAYAGPYRARPAYRFTVEDSIYIVADMHRRGIGRMLLDRLIEEAEQRGFRQMVAVIGDSDQPGSIALHAGAGFRIIGTLAAVGFKFDRWLDSVLMQRALGNGATTDPR
jgi:L-amino acid N-acyltransferase YncA